MSATELYPSIKRLIAEEALPATYIETVTNTIQPLAQSIHQRRKATPGPVVVGIHGAQGTGKSTLVRFLKTLLESSLGWRTVGFSLDDLYLTRKERQQRAETIHPLLSTRGVPGTHDMALGQQLISQLLAAGPDTRTAIPAFDKARDDRRLRHEWPLFHGRPDIILVEGWCLGARPEPDPQRLLTPINRLEREEDPQATWRGYVNDCLRREYQPFFAQLDCLIMLKAPSMEAVRQWRTLQEHKLAEKSVGAPDQGECAAQNAQTLRIMSDEDVERFVMHYERITRACLEEMPQRADIVIPVAADHSFGPPTGAMVTGDD